MSTITMEAPDRTLDQRRAALQEANRVRTARKWLKRDLKAGRESIVPVLTDPPEYAGTMRVIDVLIATPRIGRVKANKLLKQADTSPSKTLGGISSRQRSALVALLGERR